MNFPMWCERETMSQMQAHIHCCVYISRLQLYSDFEAACLNNNFLWMQTLADNAVSTPLADCNTDKGMFALRLRSRGPPE